MPAPVPIRISYDPAGQLLAAAAQAGEAEGFAIQRQQQQAFDRQWLAQQAEIQQRQREMEAQRQLALLKAQTDSRVISAPTGRAEILRNTPLANSLSGRIIRNPNALPPASAIIPTNTLTVAPVAGGEGWISGTRGELGRTEITPTGEFRNVPLGLSAANYAPERERTLTPNFVQFGQSAAESPLQTAKTAFWETVAPSLQLSPAQQQSIKPLLEDNTVDLSAFRQIVDSIGRQKPEEPTIISPTTQFIQRIEGTDQALNAARKEAATLRSNLMGLGIDPNQLESQLIERLREQTNSRWFPTYPSVKDVKESQQGTLLPFRRLRSLERQIADLEASRLQQASAGQYTPQPADTSTLIRVNSVAEAKQLPSGTRFVTPDGRIMRVP